MSASLPVAATALDIASSRTVLTTPPWTIPRKPSHAEFGVLFCMPANAGYYARLGWSAVENEVTFTDTAGVVQTAPSRHWGTMMILPGTAQDPPEQRAAADWPTGTVDLNGPDW